MDWKPVPWIVMMALSACGGQTTDVGGSDGGADHDASSLPDEGIDVTLSPLCPASPPTEGQACASGNGFQCEYGTKFWAVCDQVFTCTTGAWHLNTGQSCPGPENQDCPSSLSQITAGADCLGQSQENETCSYAQGACVCEGFCGGAFNPDAGVTWKCGATSAGCPPERPRFGSACTGNASCGYDICCAGTQLQCTNGTWQGTTMMGGCP